MINVIFFIMARSFSKNKKSFQNVKFYFFVRLLLLKE